MDLMLIGYETPITIALFVIGLIITIGAQLKVTGSYNNFRTVKSKRDLSGVEVARKILDNNGLKNIHIVEVRGQLTDHYDPSRKVIRLSHEVFHGNSIAAISVAAHEVGHAIQDKEKYTFMQIRSFIAPIVSFITYAGYFVALISLLAGVTGYIKVGILMILISLIFQLITLPVEFDASKRAKEQLESLKLINSSESENVKKMLGAAAMTYVAGVISSIINLLRLVLMLRDE